MVNTVYPVDLREFKLGLGREILRYSTQLIEQGVSFEVAAAAYTEDGLLELAHLMQGIPKARDVIQRIAQMARDGLDTFQRDGIRAARENVRAALEDPTARDLHDDAGIPGVRYLLLFLRPPLVVGEKTLCQNLSLLVAFSEE
ncbi:hypothetical protein EON76_04620 [bacterium]|nr:MAG: hypothetical protein EON76_04620 [bacterium]